MRISLSLFTLLAITLATAAAKRDWSLPSQTGYEPNVLFETHRAPSTFHKLDVSPHENHRITLRIALKTSRFDDSIDDLLERMSDPKHPKFRPHLSDKEIAELSRPDDDSIEAVSGWLRSHGFENNQIKWTIHKDWITLDDVPLRKVENMLDTKYSVYQHHDGERVIRTENYSLPSNLHRHVDLIQPTTMFGRLLQQKSSIRVIEKIPSTKVKRFLNPNARYQGNQCTNPRSVTNGCLRQLYKTANYRPRVPQGNMIGITGYLEEVANHRDGQLFLRTQRPDQVGRSFEMVQVHGGGNSQTLDQDQIERQLGVEANLDIQTTMGFTLPMQNVFWSTGGRPPFDPDLATPHNTNEPYLDWLAYILNQPQEQIPKVITTSYGENEHTVPLSYARRVCNGFAALGARGVSVIFASGDYGVGKTGFCFSNAGNKTEMFLPTFPATCPYVTSVGATENFSPEVAVSDKGPGGFFSGGGFSNYFSTPKWQQAQINRYLQFLGPQKYNGLYNRTGRGFPDVSAQGAKYVIAWQQSFLTVGGTSAAAPTFASVIALLNDYSMSLGGPSLGYLNPWLYSQGFRGLNDIISGSSGGCNTTGFSATRGWDPVTGLGTPDFPKLQRLVQPWAMAMAQRHQGWF